MKAQKTVSPVQIVGRATFKSNPLHSYYVVLSSDGVTQYHVAMFQGKACSCDCLARVECRHMKACQAREDERQPVDVAAVNAAANLRYAYGYHD